MKNRQISVKSPGNTKIGKITQKHEKSIKLPNFHDLLRTKSLGSRICDRAGFFKVPAARLRIKMKEEKCPKHPSVKFVPALDSRVHEDSTSTAQTRILI